MISKSSLTIERLLSDLLGEKLGIDARELNIHESFFQYGLDSVGTTQLFAELSSRLGRKLSPTLAYQYPTIKALADHLGAENKPFASVQTEGRRSAEEPIAIIGMACRFPKAPSIGAFWQLLCAGADAITAPPRERWDYDVLYGGDLGAAARRDYRWGGFLEQVDLFDPLFFGISPKEASQLDPQQRLMLELAWEALEDAGIPPHTLKESRTGVYCGIMWPEYSALLRQNGPQEFTQHTVLGSLHSFIPNRVSYVLGLQGPSLALDSACSSSLAAVHLACASLRRGETTLALVGGINLNLLPETTILNSKTSTLSPDGRCYTFDQRANGCVRGEGGGVVLLKPLSQARADHDPVYCIIRGSAVNNDGPSNGFSAPNPRAQEAMLRDAYAAAGLPTLAVDYVELHGTGTPLGDPIEAEALGRVLGEGRSEAQPLLVGSVKTNIGHLEAAAGMAGLIKTALALKHRQIPPSLHHEVRNPLIPAELPLTVQRTLTPWPQSSPQRPACAGVSSFGMGGTNAHVVLEEAAIAAAPERSGPVLIFSGQGAQWLGMGRSLLAQEPVFAAYLKRCDEQVQHHLGWSLIAELAATPESSRLGHIAVSWPAIVAIEIALAALLRDCGVTPALVLGHSNGEVAAAQAAGVLTLEDAMRIACTQGRVMEQIHGQGGMGLIALSWEETGHAIAAYSSQLHRAIQTSADTTVVTGEPAALSELFQTLATKGVFCRRIQVDVAGHSPQILPLADALRAGMTGIEPSPAQVPILSMETGRVSAGTHFGSEYWIRHLSSPVFFADAIAALIADGYRLFVEVSPHPIVQHAIESALKAASVKGRVLATGRRDRDERTAVLDTVAALRTTDSPIQILPLSARSPGALVAMAQAYRDLVASQPGLRPQDIAYTASRRRSHLPHRLAVIGDSLQAWQALLSAFVNGETRPGLATGRKLAERRPKLVFVFSGQGSQWAGMGRQLLAAQPGFRTLFLTCDALIKKESGHSILEGFLASEPPRGLDRFGLIQPAIFALQISLAELWRSWGVVPDAVIGHSMGEVAAAYVSGALTLEDAVAIICRRSRLLDRISGQGALLVAELPLPEAQTLCREYGTQLAVAISNGPRTTVLSGEHEAVEAARAQLEQRGIFCRRVLGVTAASHSPQMEALREDVYTELAALAPRVPALNMYSTVTGEPITTACLDESYWFRNLRDPVLFWPTIRRLAELGHELFVELSPHPVLVPAVRDGLAQIGAPAMALGSLRREQPELQCLMETLAELHVRGIEPDWARLQPGGRCIPLPAYPWQRERYWIEKKADTGPPSRRARAPVSDPAEHPLLGPPFSVSTQPSGHFWEQQLAAPELALIQEHRLHGQAVFPGTGYLDMALAAAQRVFPESAVVVERVRFERLLTLGPIAALTLQTVLIPDGEAASLQVSRLQDGAWQRHATANIKRIAAQLPVDQPNESPDAIRQRCPRHRSKQAFYQQLAAHGIAYGPPFQGVAELWLGDGELLARLEMPRPVRASTARHKVHPAWLDACLHATLASAPPGPGGTFIPVSIERLHQRAALAEQVYVHAWEHEGTGEPGRPLQYSLRVLNAEGQCLLTVDGLRLERIRQEDDENQSADAVQHYAVQWRAQDLPAARPPAPGKKGPWLLLMDPDGVGEKVIRQLKRQGHECIRVHRGSHYEKLSASAYRLDPSQPQGYRLLLKDCLGASGFCSGIVQLWSLHSTSAAQTTPETLAQDQQLGYLSALHLLQALGSAGFRDPPRVWLLTRGVIGIGAESRPLSPAQAPLWGLGRVAAIEQPELSTCRIDLGDLSDQGNLDGDAAAGEAEALVLELLSGSSEDQVALRLGQRYVARLTKSTIDTQATRGATAVRADRTYLVTGGLKGLGLAAASWLTELGARQLVLLGRGHPTAEAQQAIARLREAGAAVVTAQVDVASYAELCAVMAGPASGLPPLGGIVHAAAVLDDGLLDSQSAERFARLLPAKVFGTWNLHRLTQDQQLDFFFCYSSAASILGSPGQANYAAVNAFLDAFAQSQQQAGRNTASINWGLFTEVGMMAGDTAAPDRWSARGMQGLSLAAAKQVFLGLLREPRAQLGPMKFDARKWLEFYPYLAGSSFWTELRQEPQCPTGAPAAAPAPWLELLRSASPSDRGPKLESLLIQQLGRLLRLDPARVDRQTPFRDLGMDSLMHLELRNHLEVSLGTKLPLVLLLTYPTLSVLSKQLLDQLALTQEPQMTAPISAAVDSAALLADNLDQRTDEELLALLKQEMELAKKGSTS